MIIHIIVSTPVVPPKLQQKVYQRFLVNRGVLYDILKVYGDGAMPHRPTHVEPRQLVRQCLVEKRVQTAFAITAFCGALGMSVSSKGADG